MDTTINKSAMGLFLGGLLALWNVSEAEAQRTDTRRPFVRDHGFEKAVTLNNVELRMDERLRTPQTFSGVNFESSETTPEAVARDYLRAVAKKYGMDPSLDDIELFEVSETPGGTHLAFRQVLDGVPVYLANITVTLNHDNTVTFTRNNYRPEVYDTIPQAAVLSERDAVEAAEAYLTLSGEPLSPPSAELLYFVSQDGVRLVWNVRLMPRIPFGAWQLFVDAIDGRVVHALNRISSLDGRGDVFLPDPLTSAQVAYGHDGDYLDNDDADADELTAELVTVDLLDISVDATGAYVLEGPYCIVENFTGHTAPLPSSLDGDFFYTRAEFEFEGVMAYYYVDSLNRYADSLGYHSAGLDGFRVDPHGDGPERQANYWWPPLNVITLGDGQIDAGEDGSLISHEFGHAMEFNLTPGSIEYFHGDISESVIEGTSDYWAASVATELSDFGWEMVGTWWFAPEGWLRTVDATEVYPEDFDEPGYGDAPIWSSSLMNLWWDVGKTVADTLVLEMHNYWGNTPDFTSAALGMIRAEESLYGGGYRANVLRAFDEHGIIKYIETIPYADTAPTTGRTREWDVPGSDAGDAEYMIHLERDAVLDISVCSPSTDFDTILEVFDFDHNPMGLVNDDDGSCPQTTSSSLRNVSLSAGDYFIVVAGKGTAEGTFELTVTAPHDLAVYTLDEGDHESNIIKPRFYIENNGVSTVSDFILEYYFFVSEGRAPLLEDYWTPECDVYLEQIDGGLYRIVFDFDGVTLGPGDRIPPDSGIIVGVHFGDWSHWHEGDDYSDPAGPTFTLSDTVAIFDSEDNLIYGTTPTSGPGPAALAVYSLDETLFSTTMTQPRLYLENLGETPLSDFVVKYYFTLDWGNSPVFDPYWTPECVGYLEDQGGGVFAVVLDFTGYTLPSGGRVPDSSGLTFGIHDVLWRSWNKSNDHSQPLGNAFALTDTIAVFDSSDMLIYGIEP